MPTNVNPFTELRTALINANKPAGIATRVAYCVLAATSHKVAEYMTGVLDTCSGMACTAYTDALRSAPFCDESGWHHTYERLRHHALSYLETRHRSMAA